ncbi:hypothetical protein [Pseudoduganella violaceinigra]|uniref:hypothetical protein n=1 Tax=Pseudoduganella violaceinigra TaxID=246602 RepID=UPI00048570D3|nr:hypothetical protein [Pseudoduganella violaceinigra]
MLHLAIALALATYWCSFYLPLPPYGFMSLGFAVVPLIVLGGSFILWFLMLRKLFGKHKLQGRLLEYALGLANSLALLTIMVHAYNAYSSGHSAAPTSIDAIMVANPILVFERVLRACYPFVKLAVLCLGLAYGYRLYRATRHVRTFTT